MAFACPNCGRPHPSSGARGRAIRCACGQTLVDGSIAPGAASPGPPRPPPLPARAPSPASGYDPAAAHHGLLIDERQAQALAAPSPFLVPEVDDADVEPVPSPSEPAGRDEPRRQGTPRPRRGRRSRALRRAAAVLVLLAAAGGAAWYLFPRYSARLPPAVAEVLHRLRGLRGPGPAAVASALEASAMPFHACIQTAERGSRRLHLSGRRVTLRVTVSSSGRVTAPRLDEADLDGSPLGACLRSAARRMVFPPFSGEPVEVRIPLELDGRG